MNKKAYIAGKMSGLSQEQVQEKFQRATTNLSQQGYNVVTSVTNHIDSSSWEDTMRHSIKAMLDCDEVHLLPCWQDSRGAQLERDIAIRLGMNVVYH
jgi:hypothetical protein